MVNRYISEKASYLLSKFPVLTVTGPRQSGKTTLIKHLFNSFAYYSLEDPDIRELIMSDPKNFLKGIGEGIILDEVQQIPELLSYIQTFSDENPTKKFVLSGSQNFSLLENISQSLAGRTGILKLLPFSLQELDSASLSFNNFEKAIFYGGFPRIYDMDINPNDFYPAYIQTYIERDVRQVKNITDLNQFMRFIRLCAGRTGTLLNMNSLASDTGVSVNTVKSWLTVLEASYVIYLLQPYFKNYNKRLVKMPKLYFYDTGLACSLLGLNNEKQLSTYYKKGDLFENLIINEFLKNMLNKGKEPTIYFWRDLRGNEIDCLFESEQKTNVIEIKTSGTYNPEYFQPIGYWNKISGNHPDNSFLIYTGENKVKTKFGHLLPWTEMSSVLNKL